MTFDSRNLVQHTVRATTVYETLRCEVGNAPSVWSLRYISWVDYHRWPAGERATGCCLNCGKTLKQVTVRINPKTGQPVRKVPRIEPPPAFKWSADGKRARA